MIAAKTICLAISSGISAVVLLYLALFVSPLVYHSPSVAISPKRLGESAAMTIRAAKFTPE